MHFEQADDIMAPQSAPRGARAAHHVEILSLILDLLVARDSRATHAGRLNKMARIAILLRYAFI